jgi:DNA modification methylase
MPDVTLHLGDCLEVLATLTAGSIGHVVTDPPYGQTNERYDRGVDPAVWRECYRVAADGAALLSFAGSPTYHRIASDIEAAGWQVRQMWGWIYRNGFMTSAYPKEGFDRLRPAFDPIVFATKGKVLLNLEREGPAWDKLTGRDPTRQSFREFGLSTRNGTRKNYQADGHYPTCLIAAEDLDEFRYFVLSPNSPRLLGEKTGHPNQKPLALMCWLVSKLPVRPGPILDHYMGSGTTALAALDCGHDFLGIEVNPDYHTLAGRRPAAARAERPLLNGIA